MKIDAIDVYWMKLPLAFVWKTSYADQSFTDTILVRMEGGGHEAWGESCPPFIPGYSAEHTLAVFHTLREHMVPRIIGQDIETARDLLDRLAFIKGNQFARAALDIAWWVLDALEEPERSRFEARYAELVARAYPPRADGRTLFPFRRLFIVARAR